MSTTTKINNHHIISILLYKKIFLYNKLHYQDNVYIDHKLKKNKDEDLNIQIFNTILKKTITSFLYHISWYKNVTNNYD
jgi:hypothetical protein